ncbi:MAG: YIP1 family protein [Pseudobdellovibrio sp.]
MRDVTPPPDHTLNVRELLDFLIDFVKNPVEKIRTLPDWNWTSLFTLHVVLSLISGVLAGLLKLNFYRILAGLFLMPIVSTVTALLMTMFLYYYFQFFENKTEHFKKLFTLVVLSSIPFYFFQIVSEYLSFISVIGFAMTSLLGLVGLCDNFGVEKKRATIVVGSLFALVLCTWISTHFV